MRHPPSIYKPLSDTFKSLRLIEVLPLSSDGLIYIRMREARTPGRYQCLSYMWGDASEETEAKVIVNGQPKYVRRNLYTFLQTAQQRFTEQPLWVDALCINQDDDVEKSHQVQRMGHIYRFAESVIIWLGVEVELTPLFEFVNFLWYAYGVADGNRTIVLAFPEYPIETRRERIINSAFQRLCSNPYWSRTWVAQEVLLAQRIIIVNAEEEMGFESLNQVLLPSVDDSGKERSMLKKFANSRRQHQGKGQFQNMQAVIWDLLEWLGDSHCGDERDHIYGLLSLVKGGRSFTVDYGEDVCSLFWRAGEHFRAWTKQKSMHLLCRTLGLTIERLQENLTSTVKLKPSLIVGYICSPERDRIPELSLRTMDDHAPGAERKTITCPICFARFGALTGEDILVCLEMRPGALYDRKPSHALFTPNRGTLTVLLFPAEHTYARNYLEIGACVPEGLLENAEENGGIPSNTGYRIRLPADYVLESIRCVETQERYQLVPG